MTEIIRSLDEIDPGYSVLFCDLWGCLHDGVRAFPAAVAALERYRARKGAVVLLTRVTDLAQPFEISLNAVSKHIRMLERAQLVRRRRVWREHWVSFNSAPLEDAEGSN